MRIEVKESLNHIGEEITLYGWVDSRRDHGKIIFIDLRDRSGLIQAVFLPNHKEAYVIAEKLRSEWVLKIKGKVNSRPGNMINDRIITGKIEIEILEIEVLSEAKTPPFEISSTGYEIGEETRVKYRYLDLRRERMKDNMVLRHKVVKFVRDYLDQEGFLEIETPILTKSTPEGARDYVVPSRLYPGNFYALPQSPQQYKQLLMIAGMEKYFQFARCFRDEDTRGDRQPEFTQMDLEMSFVEREDVMALNEKLLISLISKITPEKKIQEIPFPRLSYQEAMEKYQTDKPDLRKDKNDKDLLAFCWIIDFPFFEKNDDGSWTFTHNPFSAPISEHYNWLIKHENIDKIIATQYDIVSNGYELGGGGIRNHKPEALKSVFEIMGYSDERIENNFGHMLEALSYGTPPHGGIAWGLERLIMLLSNEANIREVMAFPKTGDSRDLMMDSPSKLDDKQIKELHLKIN